MTKEYSDYLAHHGVKGQKWGIRRYQNEDGTLIHPKGRKPKAESDTWKKKDAKYLSDDELNRRNNRMQREFQYKQNVDNRHPAKKEIGKIAAKIFAGTAIAVASAAMTKNYKSAIVWMGNSAAARFMKRRVASIAAARVIGKSL